MLGICGWSLPNASTQNIILKIDSIAVECSATDTILLPVKVYNFENVGSMQFSVTWNTTNLKYIGISGYNPLFASPALYSFNEQNAALGNISFSWVRPGGLSAPSGAVIFNIALLRLAGGNTPVIPADVPTAIEFGDISGLLSLPYDTIPGAIIPQDNQPPSITCPPNLTVQSSGSAIVNGIAPTNVADNCGIQQVGWSSSGATVFSAPSDPDASGSAFNQGLSVVTYQATDILGLTNTCNFLVAVQFSASSDTLTLVAEKDSAACGSQMILDITAFNFDSITSLQFSLNWDPLILQFASVTNFNPALQLVSTDFNTLQTNNGILGFGWTSKDLFTGGTTLPSGAILFQLVFNLPGNYGDISPLAFTDIPTPREASSFLQQNQPIDAIWIDGSAAITDNIPPAITCPANITVDALPGQLTADVSGLQPAASDNCGGAQAITYSQSGATSGQGTGNAAGTYNAGTTTVIYNAIDQAGNSATCAFTVTVDAGIPVTLSADTLLTDCQSFGDTITIPIRVSDLDDIFGLLFAFEWDESVLQFVSVSNAYPGLNISPTNFSNFSTTPSGVLQFFYVDALNGLPSIPDSGVLFEVRFLVLSQSNPTGFYFQPPLEAVDSLSFQVPVSVLPGYFATTGDQTPPVFDDCPGNVTVNTTLGQCIADFIIPTPTVTDACGAVDTIFKIPASNQYPIGSTFITFTAVDKAGNSSTCSAIVSVTESEPPSLDCPLVGNLTVIFTEPDTCIGIANWNDPIASDACSAQGLTLGANISPGDTLPVGQTTVIYTATDGLGNTATCSFVVEVKDNTPPTVICPADLTVNAATGECSAVPNFTFPTIFDACDADLDFDGSAFPSDTFGIGTTTVIYTAIDNDNNSASCTFNVTVVDGEAPQLNCPPAIDLPATDTSCTRLILISNIISAEDFCDPNSVTVTGVNTPSNNTYPIGPTTVVFQAEDGSGNTSTCSFVITIYDTLSPVIVSCPPALNALLWGDGCDTTFTWTTPLALDNCSMQSLEADYVSGSTFSTGTTIITYTAMDSSGNTATCSFTATILDTKPPKFTSPCPKDTIFTNASPCGVDYNWTFPGVSDNCDQMPLITATRDTAQLFFNGNTLVSITVMDNSGNSDTCQFTVKVFANSSPGFANVPTNLVVQGCSAAVIWIPPVPTGFCGTPDLTSTHMPGDTFYSGIDTVFYTAIDSVTGIPTTVSFTVTVQEITPPSFVNCPAGPIIVSTAGAIISDPSGFIEELVQQAGCNEIGLEFSFPDANDNCDAAPTVSQTAGGNSGSLFAIGTSNLLFRALDASGNFSVCAVPVVIAPFAQMNLQATPNPGCQGEPVTLSVTAVPGATYSWTGPASGNFGNGPANTIPVLNTASVGIYSASASLNGCIALSNEVNVQFTVLDGAKDDYFNLSPGQTDTLNVLDNDDIAPAGAFRIVQVTNAPQDIILLDSIAGLFKVTAGLQAGQYAFSYKICAANCPDLCDIANVIISIRDNDCEKFPNIISPNGDDRNEYFSIPCLDANRYPENSLVIYNQWGDLVFEASPYVSNPSEGWKGNYKNNPSSPLPDGTYFYIFKLSPTDAPKKGFIEIFR